MIFNPEEHAPQRHLIIRIGWENLLIDTAQRTLKVILLCCKASETLLQAKFTKSISDKLPPPTQQFKLIAFFSLHDLMDVGHAN